MAMAFWEGLLNQLEGRLDEFEENAENGDRNE
jgi:hypothetical protein